MTPEEIAERAARRLRGEPEPVDFVTFIKSFEAMGYSIQDATRNFGEIGQAFARAFLESSQKNSK